MKQGAIAAHLLDAHAAQRGDGGPDLLEWVTVNRPSLKDGVHFDLVNHPYLIDIYRCQAREIVIYKASQMGASEYAVSDAIYATDVLDATVLYLFPTSTHVSDFGAARIGPAIEASPYISQLVEQGRTLDERSNVPRRRGTDRVTLRRFGRRYMYLRGAQVGIDGSAPQLKSVDADQVTFDELDEMDPRAPAVADKRVDHSALKRMRWISTPTYSGVGIHAKYLETDQREWCIPCPHCGQWQFMTIKNLVIEWDDLERPVAWHGMGEARPWLACKRCGRELDRLAQGVWVARHPGIDAAGFHVTKFFSHVADLSSIIKALRSTDETKRKECFNQDLGVPYTPRGGQLTDQVLDQCQRGYSLGRVEGEATFMGIDVGKVLNVVIRGPMNESGERPLRYAGEVLNFDDAARLFRQYRVRRCVVDAMPETREARRFQESMPTGRVWLAYYVDDSKDTDAWKHDDDRKAIVLDRTRSLDITMSAFYTAESVIPEGARGLIPNYYAQLKAPVRVVDPGRNTVRTSPKPVARYIHTSPDHFAHAENYCTFAEKVPPTKRAPGYLGGKVVKGSW